MTEGDVMWQRKWVLGNWKMNGRLATIRTLLTELLPQIHDAQQVQLGVAVPTVYLQEVTECLSGSRIWSGAEDVSQFANDGAYTGETSAAMLADVGARFALVGHSERRQYFNEGNAVLRQKYQHCLSERVLPILCIGETLAEREAGQDEAVVAQQLAILADLSLDSVVVAYEPVWAIGTGQVATVAQIAAMHAFIYSQILSLCGAGVKIRVLYGGSVNAQNAADILAVAHVDGALVGGASLQPDSFAAIIQAAQTAE